VSIYADRTLVVNLHFGLIITRSVLAAVHENEISVDLPVRCSHEK
jgi:hypothetical protein